MRTQTCLVVVALLASAIPADAQQRRGRLGPPERHQLERRIQQRFNEIVRERLDLDAERSQALRDVVNSFREDREELLRRRRAVERRVASARGRVLGLTNEEAQEILEEMTQLRERELELQRREQERLAEILAPGELLEWLLLREDLTRRIRDLRRQGGPGGFPEGVPFP